MILIQNATVYAPEKLGKTDILVGGGRILALAPNLSASALPGTVRVMDAEGMAVVPGFIDLHQHFTGGGGEGGFETRAPEMTLTMNTTNGVTTALGLLGTDGISRNVESLLAKTRAFNRQGITAFMLTGAYWLPSPTLCGSVSRDIGFLDPVVGVKLAMADHRGPVYTPLELAKLAAEIRTAAMLAAKPGILVIHTGVEAPGLTPVFEVLDDHPIRPDLFLPTHVNRRGGRVTAQALELAARGCVIDATCVSEDADAGMQSAADLAWLAHENHLFDQVSFSSDAGGSLPRWNEDRTELLGMDVGDPSTLAVELRRLVLGRGMDLSRALAPLTTTPARILGLTGTKGCIQESAHADLLILDPATLEIRDVLAQGEIMVENQVAVKKGIFE